jgi:uncharacterized protein (DUF58 family)
MAAPWTLLTTRGKVLLGIGVVLGGAAIATGQRDVLIVAVFLVVLPVLALGSVLVGRPRLAATRPRSLVQIPRGERFTTRIDLARTGGLMLCDILVEETVPDAFDARVRFAVTDLRRRWQRRIHYDLVAGTRGRYRLGPLIGESIDPFGLARISNPLTGTSDVLVLPRITPLTDLARDTAAGLVGLVSRMGRVGSDDVMIREYRAGDDVRRIHWRSSARSQTLMVRREEQARDLSVTLLVDTRVLRHTGSERDGTLEWTIATAAAIALHCIEEGFALRQVTPDGPLAGDTGSLTAANVLAAYAELGVSHSADLPGHGGPAGSGNGLLIALTGRLQPADAASLVELAGSRAGAAIVCRESTDADTLVATTALRQEGWSVVEADPSTDVPEAWLRLLGAGGTR